MAYEMVMPYHLHMPSYFLETFTEYPYTYGAEGLKVRLCYHVVNCRGRVCLPKCISKPFLGERTLPLLAK